MSPVDQRLDPEPDIESATRSGTGPDEPATGHEEPGADAAALDHGLELEGLYRDLGTRLEGRYKVEVIDGRVVVREMPTADHAKLVYHLLVQLIPIVVERGWQLWPDIALFLGPQMDRYRPDVTVVPADPPMWQPDEVYGHATRLVVEVVSKSSAHDDHVVKPAQCALAGVPLYLVIDGFDEKARLLSRPVEGRYDVEITVAFGEPLHLPEPWNVAIDTGKLIGGPA
ncbi:Uma2 family endonuclease [Sphaerisporangium sp. NPDC051011]|uniref:Uma2 family endonuclease n=1 Tax=Sphaerisporangium sp. NPDC051011 TaxID=3155792 RepID=UPI0033DFD5EE